MSLKAHLGHMAVEIIMLSWGLLDGSNMLLLYGRDKENEKTVSPMMQLFIYPSLAIEALLTCTVVQHFPSSLIQLSLHYILLRKRLITLSDPSNLP